MCVREMRGPGRPASLTTLVQNEMFMRVKRVLGGPEKSGGRGGGSVA